jgi:IS4 transposase
MHKGRIIFAQLLDFLPRHELRRCVARYRGDYRVRRFSCFDQFLAMSFAQLTGRESLRDIETCLRVMRPKLYHAGFRARVYRNTLAKANERRDWRIWADLAQVLIVRARTLYAGEDFGVELEQTAYAFDSTTIDLCLSLFPWARFRKTKAAVKMHTLLDLRGNIPCFILITDGKVHDVRALDHLSLEPSAFYIMDRGYIDYRRLYVFTQNAAFFIVRAKRNLDRRRLDSRKVDKATGLRSDQTIVLCGPKSSRECPLPLRRVVFYDAENKKRFVFLTNNFALSALTITQLYKCRWQVELFFKWIKQHLRIKSFFGISENAVKTQIWIAVCVYLLVAIAKKELQIDKSLYEILQILSISLFEKSPILQALTAIEVNVEDAPSSNQLELFIP